MATPSTYDHLRPTGAEYPDGVYRVVGTDGERTTLLRVGDEDGRRVHTGELVAVERGELDRFDPAENPDGNRPLAGVLASKLGMVPWSLRAFGRQLAAHALPTAVASAFLLTGVFGTRVVPSADSLLGASILVGSLALAYVGSGRL